MTHRGRYEYPSGAVREGQILHGRIHGSGKYTAPGGTHPEDAAPVLRVAGSRPWPLSEFIATASACFVAASADCWTALELAG